MRILITAPLVALLLLVPAVSVPAQTIEQSKADAQQQVQKLQQKVEDSFEQYNYACFQLEQTRAQISEKKVELAQADQKLQVNRARLNARARAMYVNGRAGFTSVIVNARNFDDVLVGLDFEKRVSTRDAQMVSQVKAARAKIAAINASLRETESAQESALAQMASAKAAVESDLASAKGKLANLEAQERQIQEAMARAAAEANARTVAANSAAEANARTVAANSGRRSYATASSGRNIPSIAPPAIPPGAPHSGVISVAYAQLGKPYVWGAAGPDCFDCSGLVMYCYEVGAGISLPHSSYALANCGTPVSVSELKPGDILGFRGWGHVGLYCGGGNFIQAPHTGDVVKITALSTRGDFCGAVRP